MVTREKQQKTGLLRRFSAVFDGILCDYKTRFRFNAVPASKPLASREVRNNPNIFLPDELLAKMFLMTPLPPEFSEKVGKIWEEIKSAKGTAE